MRTNEITFLCGEVGGFSPDMAVLKDYISRTEPDTAYRFFVSGKIKETGRFFKEGMKAEEEKFIRPGDVVISSEGFLPEKIRTKEERILIAAGYAGLLKDVMGISFSSELEEYSANFTHIVMGSPFAEKGLLDKGGQQISEARQLQACTPLSWSMTQPYYVEKARKRIDSICPKIRGKKILFVQGEEKLPKATEELEVFRDMDLRKILSELKEDWCILTNIPLFLEKTVNLPLSYLDRFAFINKGAHITDMVLAADSLITCSALYGTAFCATRKPIRGLLYKDTAFETLVRKKAPVLMMETEKQMEEVLLSDPGQVTPEMKAFEEEMSYGAEINPCEEIRKLLS